MQKSLVFISHITEEKEIAQALQQLIETTFLGMIEVFVSSGPTSIKMGRKWLDEITHALKNCDVEVILASPESVERPWVNFEGGCGWIRDIPVIPLCHSGMTPSELPPPLNSLQAANASIESELRLVFPVLADAIRCSLPEIDYFPFISAVKEFEFTSEQIKAMQAKTPVPPTDGLLPHELATIVKVAEQISAPGENVTVHSVKTEVESAGFQGVAVVLALKTLQRKNLVELSSERDWDGDEYPAVGLTDEGWQWLEANHDKLHLRTEPTQGVVSDTGTSTKDLF